ncbi:hypothetical protein HYALB_00011237 [Hymenoscyphus albidus]|uniref:Uncharacterized protein n=1 Tax=Hymenoscyphus albidus TaxID=595503 RepID=A0A9N9PXU5_9HELO|nr:hypothetical protein HYALB_00011237 [Hymenoscyphus albidus]
MTDKLKRLIHTLKLKRKLCAHLKTFSNHVKRLQPPQVARSFCQNEAITDNYVFQNETQISQLESLVDRAQGVGFLIEHILDLRNAETNHNMNLAMHDRSKQGVEENSLVRELASQTTQDTKAMRTIAFISVIFLPATFLATFFGSKFFGFEDTKDGHSLTVASNIWIYVVTALAFSVVAVAIWYWWGLRRGSEPDKVKNADMP